MKTINILLVADTEKLILTVQRLFPKMGFNVLVSDNAKEALKYLLEHDVPVVFIDHSMHGLDAFSLLEAIRLGHPVVEVFFLVDSHELDNAAEAMRHGASDYLVKPVSIKSLLEKSEAACRRYQIHRHRIDDALHTAPLFKKRNNGLD
ncbi:response regulator [Desulfovibrio inopinatus]|uniref:response regulator n=1 Tax=Desulfovibrio inopinatus TaxID=102109 RepID=UPI0003F75C6E|nr:response regulator [Desulfovibrio inopinatus]